MLAYPWIYSPVLNLRAIKKNTAAASISALILESNDFVFEIGSCVAQQRIIIYIPDKEIQTFL